MGVKLDVPQLCVPAGVSYRQRVDAAKRAKVEAAAAAAEVGGDPEAAAAKTGMFVDSIAGAGSNNNNAFFHRSFNDARRCFGHGSAAALFACARNVNPLPGECRTPTAARKRSTEEAMNVVTPNGYGFLSPAEYLNAIDRLGVDVYASMADEHERRRSARAVDDTEEVTGIVVGGLGAGDGVEDTGSMTNKIIGWSLEGTKEEMMRAAWGVGAPEDVIDAVGLGVDVFDGEFVLHVTHQGVAMRMPLWDERRGDGGDDSTQSWLTDLRSDSLKKDVRPLVDRCSCSTCQNGFSRAYLHHLITCNEMLYQTLLHVHNVHQYSLLFQDIRDAIEGGYFDEYRDWFRSRGVRPSFQPPAPAGTQPFSMSGQRCV